jgi:hypothetical protein
MQLRLKMDWLHRHMRIADVLSDGVLSPSLSLLLTRISQPPMPISFLLADEYEFFGKG